MENIIMVGQRLVCGISGTTVSEKFIDLVKKYKVGNVILFKRNIENVDQLKKLCADIEKVIESETGYKPFIFIDQEGGHVTRLPEDAINIPGVMAIAATGDILNAKIAAKINAEELLSYGVNFNLAPVLDINNNPNNPVIGVRSFSDDCQTVIDFGRAQIEGYNEVGILNAAKHFPGHGDTNVDSHLGLPVINKSLDELEEFELKPFKVAIEKGVSAILTSHILFPKIEKEKLPCTMSRVLITDILKNKLNFKGLVISDCMEMDAVKVYYGTVNGVVQAIKAGVDVVFISHTDEYVKEASDKIVEELNKNIISKDEMISSFEKIISTKKDKLDKNKNIDFDFNKSLEIIKQIRKKSIVLEKGNLFNLGEKPFFAGCEDHRATLASELKGTKPTFSDYMKNRFNSNGVVTSVKPEIDEIENVFELAKNSTSIVLCTYNAHIFKEQLALVEKLALLNIPIMVIALRNPYDLYLVPSNVTTVAAWDYSLMTLEIIAEMLEGKFVPSGKMPICME